MADRTGKPERWNIEPEADGSIRIRIKLPPDFDYRAFASAWQKILSDASREEVKRVANKFLYGEGEGEPIGLLHNEERR